MSPVVSGSVSFGCLGFAGWGRATAARSDWDLGDFFGGWVKTVGTLQCFTFQCCLGFN